MCGGVDENISKALWCTMSKHCTWESQPVTLYRMEWVSCAMCMYQTYPKHVYTVYCSHQNIHNNRLYSLSCLCSCSYKMSNIGGHGCVLLAVTSYRRKTCHSWSSKSCRPTIYTLLLRWTGVWKGVRCTSTCIHEILYIPDIYLFSSANKWTARMHEIEWHIILQRVLILLCIWDMRWGYIFACILC